MTLSDLIRALKSGEPRPRLTGSCILPLLVLLSGCANSRRIAVESRDLDLRQVSHFHIVLNRKSEKVVYDASALMIETCRAGIP